MKKILFMLIFCRGAAFAETNTSLELFLNSFYPLGKEKKIISIEDKIFEKKNPMNKSEALEYIYNNDTTRLICHGIYINMETEKVWGHYIDTVLPYKLGKIETEQVSFIFYTTNECQNESDLWWTNGEISIYNNGTLQNKYKRFKII